MAKRRQKKKGSALAIIVAILVVIFGLRALVHFQHRNGAIPAKEVIRELQQDEEFDVPKDAPVASPKKRGLMPITKADTDKLTHSDRKELDALLDDVAE